MQPTSATCPPLLTGLIISYLSFLAPASIASADDPACDADLNGDLAVNGADLSQMLGLWGACPLDSCPEDIDGNGLIDGQDLSVLLGYWGSLPQDCTAGGPSSERHQKWPVGTRYEDQGFWEYLPVGYEQGEDWPLIIFLHGLGENGDGGSSQLERVPAHGPAKLIENDQWPVVASAAGDQFVVLSPQNSTSSCHRSPDIDAFIRWAIDFYEVDPTRVYLTGLSCGAIGSWNYLKDHLEDDLLAAVVPICGFGVETWNQRGCALGELPIWGFHGDADDVVNVIGTIFPMENIQNCSSPEAVDARLTVYSGVRHDSWSRTYDLQAGHDIYAWMLSHENPEAGP
jgi:dienelactone hydrolase